MAPAAAELEAFSATEDAFRAAQLPEPPVDDENAPLGSDVWGRYVYHILRLSGVELKLARRTAKDDESYWNAAQIVSDDTLKAALDVEELNAISMVKGDQYLGLQVKLSGACEWHITCTEEIPDRRAAAAAARSRRSTAAIPPGSEGGCCCCHLFVAWGDLISHCWLYQSQNERSGRQPYPSNKSVPSFRRSIETLRQVSIFLRHPWGN
jgi:hypothetical protein